MKHIRYFLMGLLSLFLTASINAQTAAPKKAKTAKHAHVTKYQCSMKCEGDKTYAKEGKCPVCNMKLKATLAKATAANYQCPMKCEGEKTYAKEGKCPECNMKLKKVEAKKTTNDHSGHNHS